MKKVIYILTSLFLLFFTSCKKDDNTNTSNEDPRTKFEGTWTCKETCKKDGSFTAFPVTISKNTSNSTEILIANFNNLGQTDNLHAIITGYNFTIPQQSYTSSNYPVSGSGAIDSKQTSINMNYLVNEGAQTDEYTAVLTK
ncbi:MAG: hypothetical protein WC223_06765 [Bacteroidales bacterium]|jgi:hypothetical protein